LRGWVGGSSARVRRSTLRAAQPASPPQRPAALATASQRLHCLGVSQCKVVRVRLAIGSDDTTRHGAWPCNMQSPLARVRSAACATSCGTRTRACSTQATPFRKPPPRLRRRAPHRSAVRSQSRREGCDQRSHAPDACAARLGTCCALHALRGTMNRISYPNCARSALVRLMSMRSFTSSCMQEERAATLAARVELADAKQVRARACLHACACVWLPSPMELANAQRPAKRRPGTVAPACGHLRHSVGGSRLGPVA
jgi:hypothetical protein